MTIDMERKYVLANVTRNLISHNIRIQIISCSNLIAQDSNYEISPLILESTRGAAGAENLANPSPTSEYVHELIRAHKRNKKLRLKMQRSVYQWDRQNLSGTLAT